MVACTEADAPASSQQAGSELQSLQPRGARDTGIQLAAADKKDKKDKDAPTDADWAKQVSWGNAGPGDEIYPGDWWVAAALSVQMVQHPPMWLILGSRQAVLARPHGCGSNIQVGLRAVPGGFVGSAVCLWHLQMGFPAASLQCGQLLAAACGMRRNTGDMGRPP